MAVGFAALVLVAAILIGYVAGGRLSRVSEIELRHWWLVVVAALFQGAGAVAGLPPYRLGLALSLTAALGFLWFNRSLDGVVLMAIGMVCNAVAVLANGAMPVSGE